MMKEADFHQVSDKPVKNAAETSKVVNGNGTATSVKHESNHGMYFQFLFWYLVNVVVVNKKK